MVQKPTYEELEKRINALQIENDEIRKSKQAIENSEDLHRIILENFSDTVIITDDHGKIIYPSPNQNTIFDLSHKQVYDKGTIQEVINGTACYLSELRKIKEIQNIERSILDSAGRKRFVLITLKSVSIKGGTVLYVIRDITDRKQMEQERLADFKFFESMDKVNRTIQGTTDLEQVMMDVLDIVLSIFDCDRAGIVYPCDPKALSWSAPMERTKPEWPGALTLGLEVPMDPEVARIFRVSRATDGPVEFGPGYEEQLPTGIAAQFNIQSQMTMALYPKTGQPWNFVLHQCSYPRVWTQGEKKLLTEIGRRLEGALTTLLMHRTLHDSEQRLRKIIENTGAGYFSIDSDGNFQNVNASWLRMHGYISDDDIIGRHFSATQTETDLQQVNKIVERLLSGKTTTVDEFSRLNKDGSIGYHSFSANPVVKGDKIIGLEGFIIDLTERKIAELALIDSEQRWRNILINTPQIGISLDPMGKIRFANEHFLNLTGWQEEAVIGSDWFEMFVPVSNREEIRGVFSAIFRKKDASEFTGYENEILTRNGELRTIAWSNVLTKDARGEIMDVTCLGIDVSERQRYEKELEESDLKYRQLTETMLETLSVIDLKGVFLYANRNAARNLSGGKSDDIIGKNIRQFLPEIQAEQLIGQYKEIYTSNEPYSQEVLVHLEKGNTWFSNTIKPIDFGPSQVPAVLSVSLDITKRKNAEVALHESETKYRVMFNTFPLGITISDESGNIVEANDMSLELLGISKEEHQERRIDGPEWRIIRPDRSDMPQDEWASVRALNERRVCENAEMGIVKPDGKTTWINVTAAPLLLEKYGVVIAYRDITGQKQTEENYQTLFREMIDGFALHEIICDKDGQPESYKFLAVNPAFEKMTGLKADKILGRNVLDVIPNIEPYWIETYGNVALSGKPAFFENYSAAIGKHFQVTAFRPLPGQFACIFTDITERKAAENELRESEEKFRNFTEQSFVGFYIIQDDVFKYVNPKFADIFGYTVDECMDGMRFRQLVHTEDLAVVQEKVRTRVADGNDAVQYTFRGVKKSGEVIHVSIYGSSLTYQGRPAAIGTILDITKDLEMEKRLAQSQRMESIGNLAGGIAHDFNNILFPIVGMSELLLEDFPPDSPEHENAQEIFNAGKRGSDLVKQILAFSRQSELQKIPIRIQQILKEVMKLSRSTIPVNIDITQDIQSNCSMVQADPTKIHQIAMNLITNAYHAVEPKSGEIAVRLREVEIESGQLVESDLLPGRYALLSVSDTGVGIDSAIMQKIFEPYFTTKEQGKGTGLGLAVVYGIVKEHKGDIKVNSELGKGTTFNVYLPIMEKAEKSTPAEGDAGSVVGHERILLVDDEGPIAMLEKRMLERLGYTVTMRVSSLDGLEAFKAKPESFDLVISDMTMPQMTGDQLAKELILIRADIPIIICTGFSERFNQETAANIGVKGFLMKPIIKSELAKMVRKVLDGPDPSAANCRCCRSCKKKAHGGLTQ